MYGRIRIQNLLDSFRSHSGTGKHNGNHGDHQEGHDNLHGIGDKRHHVAYLKVPRIDSLSSEPYDHDGNTVHNQHHHRHHKGHDTVGEQLGFHQILICGFKTVFLEFFPAESTDDGDSGKDFPGHQIQTVHQGLHFLEFGHSHLHQHKHHDGNSRYRYPDNPAQAGFSAHYLDNTAYPDDRGIQHHTQQHNLHHLYLLDIVGASRDQRSNRKLIQLVIGKGHNLGKNLSP